MSVGMSVVRGDVTMNHVNVSNLPASSGPGKKQLKFERSRTRKRKTDETGVIPRTVTCQQHEGEFTRGTWLYRGKVSISRRNALREAYRELSDGNPLLILRFSCDSQYRLLFFSFSPLSWILERCSHFFLN